MTTPRPPSSVAREFFGCKDFLAHVGNHSPSCEQRADGDPIVYGCESLAALLTSREEMARGEERERCAKVVDERARRLNLLGCDADQPGPKGFTIGLLQAERRLEAQHIAAALRALAPKEAR